MDAFLLIWKNKGILVPFYMVCSFIFFSTLSGVLKRNIGGIFVLNYDLQLETGIVLLVSGILTYFTRDDYIKVNGKKEKMDTINEFFFISMERWAYLLIGGGILVFMGGVVETIDKFS